MLLYYKEAKRFAVFASKYLYLIIVGLLKIRKGAGMEKWECQVCGYIYDPEKGDPDGGIEPGTKFEDLPDDWVCPECGASKDEFEVYES